MTKYRPHRGALADSMREVVEVSDLKALARVLGASPGRVTIAPYGFDARVDWDTHIVKVDGVPIGFTNGPVPPNGDHQEAK